VGAEGEAHRARPDGEKKKKKKPYGGNPSQKAFKVAAKSKLLENLS